MLQTLQLREWRFKKGKGKQTKEKRKLNKNKLKQTNKQTNITEVSGKIKEGYTQTPCVAV